MTKKSSFLLLGILTCLILMGCSTATQVVANTTGAGTEISDSILLALGTLKLEDTPLAVDTAQAAQLLPLWKAARSISQSDTAAQAEVDAIFKQIGETMSSEQLEAMQTMQFEPEDLAALAEELGMNFAPGRNGTPNPEIRATMEAARASGQFPQPGAVGGFGGEGFPQRGTGGGGGEGGFAPGGLPGEGLPQANQTPVPGSTTQRARNNSELIWYQAVITLLESKQ